MARVLRLIEPPGDGMTRRTREHFAPTKKTD